MSTPADEVRIDAIVASTEATDEGEAIAAHDERGRDGESESKEDATGKQEIIFGTPPADASGEKAVDAVHNEKQQDKEEKTTEAQEEKTEERSASPDDEASVKATDDVAASSLVDGLIGDGSFAPAHQSTTNDDEVVQVAPPAVFNNTNEVDETARTDEEEDETENAGQILEMPLAVSPSNTTNANNENRSISSTAVATESSEEGDDAANNETSTTTTATVFTGTSLRVLKRQETGTSIATSTLAPEEKPQAVESPTAAAGEEESKQEVDANISNKIRVTVVNADGKVEASKQDDPDGFWDDKKPEEVEPASTAAVAAPVEETKEAAEGETKEEEDASPPQPFVNAGFEKWQSSRRVWLSCDHAKQQQPRCAKPLDVDDIIDVIFTSTRQVREQGGPKSFSQPVPLPQMIDILVDLWEAEGLDV